MSTHRATVEWKKDGDFARKKYQRAHTWRFDGGLTVRAAASPHVVPLPQTVEDAVDPEEALVASASSCHMLTFLFLAANDGSIAGQRSVDQQDAAGSRLARDPRDARTAEREAVDGDLEERATRAGTSIAARARAGRHDLHFIVIVSLTTSPGFTSTSRILSGLPARASVILCFPGGTGALTIGLGPSDSPPRRTSSQNGLQMMVR